MHFVQSKRLTVQAGYECGSSTGYDFVAPTCLQIRIALPSAFISMSTMGITYTEMDGHVGSRRCRGSLRCCFRCRGPLREEGVYSLKKCVPSGDLVVEVVPHS